MTSQKRIEANCRNAQKSTGPRTQSGKDAARLNAVKHGLRTFAVEVLPNEDADAFQRSVIGWVRDLDPRTEAELTLTHQAATISWKLDRADRYETAVLSRRMIEAVNECNCADDDVQALHEAAAIGSFDPSIEGERIRRYQFALMRELRQTIDAVTKLRKQSISPNEATWVEDAAASNEAISDESADALGQAGGVSPLSGSEADDQGLIPIAREDERTQLPDNTSLTREDERTQFSGIDDRKLTPPSRQEEETVVAPNEPISQAEPAPTTRVRRDRWPLETLKKRRQQEKRRQRRASAFAG